MFNKLFLKWIIIAFIIAVPVSWYIMNRWLDNFAYRTAIHWWIFAIAGGITFYIVIITISWNCLQTARKNPVEAIRDE